MSFLDDITSGNCYAAFVRGPLTPPFTLAGLVAAGLVGFSHIEPIESAEWQATGAKAFRARFEYQWTNEDSDNVPVVLASFLGSPPTRLLWAATWSFPSGYVVSVGTIIAVPIFFTVQLDEE
jgi:hypothetical protein